MPVGAVVAASAIGGIASANAAKKAGNQAADAQRESAQQSIEEQRRQFDAMQQLLSPYNEAGLGALGAQQNLLGLNGYASQNQAIDQLKNGGQFYELARQQEDALLQNAAATGGLRGGNLQAALAQFRPNLLQQMIQSQYANLGGLTNIGQNSAAMVGNAGQNMANSVSNLYNQQGAAQAGAYLNAGKQQGNMYNSLVGGVSGFSNMAAQIPTGIPL